MQTIHSIPQSVSSPRDPARLSFERWCLTGKARTAAVALLVLTGLAVTSGPVNADLTYGIDVRVAFGFITTDGHLPGNPSLRHVPECRGLRLASHD
jgi:hypothetical protein